MFSRTGFLLLSLVLLAGCTSQVTGSAAPGTTLPPAPTASPATPGVARPGEGVGPFRTGDCLELRSGEGRGITKVPCTQPHEYEVSVSAAFAPEVASTYPPKVDTLARPACRTAMPAYLGSPDADASVLETFTFWPTESEWGKGERWFACLVTARGPDNHPVKQPGVLAGALTKGLGRWQECRAGKPLEESPIHVVPCTEPHRAEAVPGVRDLGKATDPPIDLGGPVVKESIDHCTAKVNAYLGGPRPGVQPSAIMPIPADWVTGTTTLICYAISDTPVTGPMGRA